MNGISSFFLPNEHIKKTGRSKSRAIRYCAGADQRRTGRKRFIIQETIDFSISPFSNSGPYL